MTEQEVERVDAQLPLHRLDVAETYVVAWDGDEPLGHAHIAWEATELGVPEIQDVFVLPERRRRGVATALTHAAERLAHDRGHERISLTVGLANEPARRLYAELGYEDAGLPPRRVRGTITIRGRPFEVDDTLLHLHKALGVDPNPSRSS